MSWTDPRTGLTHYPPPPDRYIRAAVAERQRRKAALDETVDLPAPEMLLLLFAEYLDGEHLLLTHEQSRDDRAHDKLARDFLADLTQRRQEK